MHCVHVECTGVRARGAGGRAARGEGRGGVFTARRGGRLAPARAPSITSVVVGHTERARTACPDHSQSRLRADITCNRSPINIIIT